MSNKQSISFEDAFASIGDLGQAYSDEPFRATSRSLRCLLDETNSVLESSQFSDLLQPSQGSFNADDLGFSSSYPPAAHHQEHIDTLGIEPTPIGPSSSLNVVQSMPLGVNNQFRNQDYLQFLQSQASKPNQQQSSAPTFFQYSFFPNEATSLGPDAAATSGADVANTCQFDSDEGDDLSGIFDTPQSVDTLVVPVVRNFQSEQWNDRFLELVQFNNEHGHCLVPHNYHLNPSLAQWVKRHRYQYKLKDEGKHSTLTNERESALNYLGFVWDSHRAVWEERLNELKDFHRRHGHCNVPTTYPENPQLSIWVKCQRRQYKLMLCGRASNMTEERIVELLNLDFVWNPRKLKGVPEVTKSNLPALMSNLDMLRDRNTAPGAESQRRQG